MARRGGADTKARPQPNRTSTSNRGMRQVDCVLNQPPVEMGTICEVRFTRAYLGRHIIGTLQEHPIGSSAAEEMSSAFCDDRRRAKPQSC